MLYAVQLPVVYSGSTAPSPRAGAENVLADGKCPEAETCAVRRLNASGRGFLHPAYSIIAVNNIAILPFDYSLSLSLSLFYFYSTSIPSLILCPPIRIRGYLILPNAWPGLVPVLVSRSARLFLGISSFRASAS